MCVRRNSGGNFADSQGLDSIWNPKKLKKSRRRERNFRLKTKTRSTEFHFRQFMEVSLTKSFLKKIVEASNPNFGSTN